MMTNRNITNVGELKAEISRLKRLRAEQEGYLQDQFDLLKEKVESPFKVIGKIASWIPKMKVPSAASAFDHPQSDWVTNSLRVGLPFLFNKVLFRKAGFIKKTLLLLASQKAAGAINQDRIASLIDKVSAFIRPESSKRKGKRKHTDYGIPPDSETY